MLRAAGLLTLCLGVLLALTAGPTSSPVEASDTDPRPNIILITTDDQAVSDLRFMPFTRRLIGGEGVRFDDAIAPNPLCCPARATIMTGQHSHNNGVHNNTGEHGGYRALRPLNQRTLPVWLQRAGYQTTFIGKYLNGYGKRLRREVPPGWDSWNGSVEGLGTYDYYGSTINHDGELVDYTGEYQADVHQDILEQRVREGVADDQPFFIWQSNLAPHGACRPREGGGCRWGPPAVDRQDADRFSRLPLASRRSPSFNERVVRDKPRHLRALDRWGPDRIQHKTDLHRARVRSLQAVDRNVRDTVQLLERHGELANSVIIFASDNGYLLGQHRHLGKILPYTPSLRVPLLMRGPGIPPGTVRSQSTALVDIAPTIAAAAGAEPMLTQDGRSLLPLARGTSTRGYGAVAIESGPYRHFTQGWFYRGVRTPRWTYVVYPQSHEYELYDRSRDPHELTNLAYRPTHRAVRAALQDKLERLRDCAGRECRTVSAAVPRPRAVRAPVHPDELGSVGSSRQVVTLTARHWSTGRGTLVAWQRTGRTWRVARGPFQVQLGARGLAGRGATGHEVGKTPAGTFRVSSAFGRLPDPGNGLPYRRIEHTDFWPMDRANPRTYNVLQTRKPPQQVWRPGHYEHLWAHRFRFPHALVLDHNLARGVSYSPVRGQRVAARPANVRKGSFLVHAGDRLGKHGWVSMEPARLTSLVRWMRPGRDHPTFVVGTPQYLRGRL